MNEVSGSVTVSHELRIGHKEQTTAKWKTSKLFQSLRDALDNLYDARIPTTWKRISWVSSTLGFWYDELLDRNTQFHTWCFKGRPIMFWMTGFFNPQGKLTWKCNLK
jgi:hypothetical protein